MRYATISLYPAPAISAGVLSGPTTSREVVISQIFHTAPPGRPTRKLKQVGRLKYASGYSVQILSPGVLPLLHSLLKSVTGATDLPPFSDAYEPGASVRMLFPTPNAPLVPAQVRFPRGNERFSVAS